MRLFKFYSWCIGLGCIMAGGLWVEDVTENKLISVVYTVVVILLWSEAGMAVFKERR